MNELIHDADTIEAAACADLYAAGADVPGTSAQTIGGATVLIAPSIPVSHFNRVIGLGVDQAATEADLDAIEAAFRASGVNSWWVHRSPLAQPAALEEWLRQRRYALPPRRAWAKLVRDPVPAAPAPTALAVRAATPADAQAIGVIACSAYDMPAALAPWFASLAGRSGWQLFVACDGPAPVATGALFVRDGIGWLGIGATLADCRGRGAQSALLAARIDAARAAGCRLIVTETGEPVGDEANPSLANIRRAGFVQVCSRLNYAAPQD
ncbi:GNAT family N-acetyltransferase [Fontimonas sp. SYSU GA230001]|uniref:GNAT family N-acetyltransferase n=1 Tax=Fontimonas sp. SYSU GA230001 TaxID=3142450 RepID=UPI0032B50557